MNHESALDVPLAVVACPRPITFMSKKDLYKNALASWALHELGGFRVDRRRFDLESVRIAVAAIRRGDVLGMYPEGTRAPGALLPFLPGAAWLALAMGAPLVPLRSPYRPNHGGKSSRSGAGAGRVRPRARASRDA